MDRQSKGRKHNEDKKLIRKISARPFVICKTLIRIKKSMKRFPPVIIKLWRGAKKRKRGGEHQSGFFFTSAIPAL